VLGSAPRELAVYAAAVRHLPDFRRRRWRYLGLSALNSAIPFTLIAAALVMSATGWYPADPLLLAGIGALVLWSSWRLLRESVDVLLEAAPKYVNATEVCDAMGSVDGVATVHDLHVWTVTSELVALSSHVEVSGTRDWPEVLAELTTLLQQRFGIAHVTVQPEEPHSRDDAFRGCSFGSSAGRLACQVPTTAARPAPAHHGHHH